MTKAYVFSEADVQILQRLIAKERNRPQNTPIRDDQFEQDHQAPEVYVCVDDHETYEPAVLDQSDKTVYKVTTNNDGDPVLTPISPLDKTVYSLGPRHSEEQFLVSRDKAGNWFRVGQRSAMVRVVSSLGGGLYSGYVQKRDPSTGELTDSYAIKIRDANP